LFSESWVARGNRLEAIIYDTINGRKTLRERQLMAEFVTFIPENEKRIKLAALAPQLLLMLKNALSTIEYAAQKATNKSNKDAYLEQAKLIRAVLNQTPGSNDAIRK